MTTGRLTDTEMTSGRRNRTHTPQFRTLISRTTAVFTITSFQPVPWCYITCAQVIVWRLNFPSLTIGGRCEEKTMTETYAVRRLHIPINKLPIPVVKYETATAKVITDGLIGRRIAL